MRIAYCCVLAAALGTTPLAQAACTADLLSPVSYKISIDGREWKRNDALSVVALTERTRIRNAKFINDMPEATEHNARKRSLKGLDAGVTSETPSLDITFTLMQTKGTAQEICFAITKLTATFYYKDAELAIAHELTTDACAYQEAVAHEMQHVVLHEELLHGFYPRLRELLRQTVEAQRIFAAPDMKAAQDKTLARFQTAIQKILKEFVVGQAQQSIKIDSPEEYARLGAACDGRLRAILKRAAEMRPSAR